MGEGLIVPLSYGIHTSCLAPSEALGLQSCIRMDLSFGVHSLDRETDI